MTLNRRALRTSGALAAAVLALAVAACGGGDNGSVDVGGGGSSGGSSGGGPGGPPVAAVSAKPDKADPHTATAYPSVVGDENVFDTPPVADPQNLRKES